MGATGHFTWAAAGSTTYVVAQQFPTGGVEHRRQGPRSGKTWLVAPSRRRMVPGSSEMSLPAQSMRIAFLGVACLATAVVAAAPTAAQPADCQSPVQSTSATCSLSAPGSPNLPSADAYLPAPNLPAAVPGLVSLP